MFMLLWSKLFTKIGNQNLKWMSHHHVYALLENPDTLALEKIYLDLKHDACGHPYFIRSKTNK